MTTKPLDEGEQYPVLDIKQLVDWNEVRTQERDTYYDSRPTLGDMADTTGPGHRGITALAVLSRALWLLSLFLLWPYYGPYYGFPAAIRFRLPLLLPPSSIPPQFRKD